MLRMFAILCRLSSLVDRKCLFLDHLACVFYLSSFGVVLRFCVSRRSDSSLSLFVIAWSWGCSSSVVEALLVMTFSCLSLRSSVVLWLVVVLELVVLRACSWCAW